MKKRFTLIFLILTVFLGLPSSALLQWGAIKIKEQPAYVLEFKSPYESLRVDLDENKVTTDELTIFTFAPGAVFVDNKNKPLDKTLIRRGMRVEITGERVGEKFTASRIKVKTDVEKWKVKVDGILESLEGDKAWIDGQSVKLVPGTIVRGEGKWKKQTSPSFVKDMIGAWVDVEGTRQTDGIVDATKVEIKPNLFSESDKKLKEAVEQNIPKNLIGGKGKVMGEEVTFSDNRELQAYITRVGNRLIPRYHKDMPNDYPGKIVYRFAVIEHKSFNAFALPDGAIFIHTGLLKQIRNEAQLAAVLGHEIAHVTYEHSRKRMDSMLWMNLASLGAILGGAAIGGKDGAAIGALGGLALINGYDQNSEDQADRVGLYYMSQAGYDLREATKIWRELKKYTKENATNNFFYSGHSLPSERLRHLNRYIAYNYYDITGGKIGKEEYDDVVGVHFGWATKKPKVTPPSNQPSPPATPPKPTQPKLTPKPKPKPRVRKRP